MRLMFSVVALLVVAFVVLNLARKQAQVLVPAAAASRPASTAATPGPATPPQQVQQNLNRTFEQALQQRASEPGQ
jgi:hypothetical protein